MAKYHSRIRNEQVQIAGQDEAERIIHHEGHDEQEGANSHACRQIGLKFKIVDQPVRDADLACSGPMEDGIPNCRPYFVNKVLKRGCYAMEIQR